VVLTADKRCRHILLKCQWNWSKTVTQLSKKKVAHTRLQSVGFRSWSRFLAVSLQVTWVKNLTVGCHYFPPGLRLPPQPLRWLLPILLLGEQYNTIQYKICKAPCCRGFRGTMGVNSLPKTVTRQRCDCDLNSGPSAPESSMLTTRLTSHPMQLRAEIIWVNKSISETKLKWVLWQWN